MATLHEVYVLIICNTCHVITFDELRLTTVNDARQKISVLVYAVTMIVNIIYETHVDIEGNVMFFDNFSYTQANYY